MTKKNDIDETAMAIILQQIFERLFVAIQLKQELDHLQLVHKLIRDAKRKRRRKRIVVPKFKR